MKRKFAVIMSAALAAGSTMPVMAESETHLYRLRM